MYSHSELLDRLFQTQAIFTVCYLISALVIGGNSFAGFNAIFLGIVFAGGIVGSYYGIKVYISRVHFGAILGGSVILMFVALESSIFWGQYSDCETPSRRLGPRVLRNSQLDPDCHNKSAMKSLCAFSVFMFLSYIAELALLVRFKNDILGNNRYEETNYATVPTADYRRSTESNNDLTMVSTAVKYAESTDV